VVSCHRSTTAYHNIQSDAVDNVLNAFTFLIKNYSDSGEAVASLNVLSNELLFMAAEHLFDEAQDRSEDDELPPATSSSSYCGSPYSTQSQAEILRYDPVLQDGSGTSVTALKNMASTSRRFRDMAQPALYKEPVLSIGKSCRWNQKSPIYLFARTMLENPR
jgi:hypothetical protein